MQYDLVFEGGGAKGMVFVGAMQEFEARGHTYGRLLGTSAGAIGAVLLTAGYTSDEVRAALSETVGGRPVFETFMGPPAPFDKAAVENSATLATLKSLNVPFVPQGVEEKIDTWLTKALLNVAPNLFSLIERGGWYSAASFVDWLSQKLDSGTFQGKPRKFSPMTLSQLYAETKRDLSLVTSDTTGNHMLVLNHNTAPNLPVVWAVRMSMSIPLLWPEVAWQADWGTYLDKPQDEIVGHLMVDGGILSNFPLELFISEDDHVTELMGPKTAGRTLGLLIDETLDVPNTFLKAAKSSGGFNLGQLQLAQRIFRLINTATGAHDKMVIEAFDQLVVHLPAKGYGTTEFDMTPDRREALINAGQTAMRDYFNFRDDADFSLAVDPTYEMHLGDHADQVANDIFGW